MTDKIIFAVIAVVIIGILVFLWINHRKCIMDIILRGFIGLAIIYVVNAVFAEGTNSYFLPIGVNALTIGISAFLGIPGIILLYGIAWFFKLQ